MAGTLGDSALHSAMGPDSKGTNGECRPKGYSGAGVRKSEAVGNGEESVLPGAPAPIRTYRIGLKAMHTF